MSGDDDHIDETAFAEGSTAAPAGEKIDDKPARTGPPEDWESESWFDYRESVWWYKWPANARGPGGWRIDPLPIRPLGFNDGVYTFSTRAGEVREFTAQALYGRSGVSDMFGGQLAWPNRHFPGVDQKGNPTKRPNAPACMDALIRLCEAKGFIDGTIDKRRIGVWAGPDGRPIVHAGNAIFSGDELLKPGVVIDGKVYVVGEKRQAPAHTFSDGRIVWQAGTPADGQWVVNALGNWNWLDQEACELYAGARFVHMLADAPRWKVHQFIQAPPEAGKTTLLHFTKAIGGGSTGPFLKTYSKALIEQSYNDMGLAVLLDESESDLDADRIKHLFELIRLLSDDGAVGGRGTAGGKARSINVHGPVTMAGTVRERWRPQDRRRITLLHLKPLLDRAGGSEALASKDTITALTRKAAELSPRLRARAIACFDLLQQNFKAAHKTIVGLGGTSGDGDQLGWQIAGWRTLTSDAPPDDAFVDEVKRFIDYIRTLAEADEDSDESTDCFGFLLSSDFQGLWKGGQQFTIGQMIARGREADGGDAREALQAKGLRLIPDPLDRDWLKASLAIANKHAKLEELFAKRPEWGGEKWNQAMEGLAGARRLTRKEAPLRFGGAPTRALIVPPVHLPLVSDGQP